MKKILLVLTSVILFNFNYGQCPDSSNTPDLAEIMDVHYTKDYRNCNLQVEVLFVAKENFLYNFMPSMKKYIAFTCSPKNSYSHLNIFINKNHSSDIFNLSSGQPIKLYGKVYVARMSSGQEYSYFIANKIEQIKVDVVSYNSDQCPDSTKVTSFAQIMDLQFAKDFKGCKLYSEAIFIGTGTGGYRIPPELRNGYVAFMCYPKGNKPTNNPLGQRVGNFVFIDKDKSSKVFNLSSGQNIKLYGKVHISNNHGYKQSNFIADRIEILSDNKKEDVTTLNRLPVIKSDVDMNIPISNTQQASTYALIIGNEDYKSKQKNLTSEQNVDFAENDARIFAEYCNKTLGVPNKQIKLVYNGTSAEINQGLAWINNLSRIEKGNSKLLFYYSGHGLPHEQTKEAYIIPVDVSGNNLDYAIRIKDIYKKLNEQPSKQITVFIDACFSGGARNKELISMKGVKIKPKENQISGNMVVFTSSTGDESSAVYKEKQHGYFTYFLLKKLKETKGQVSFNDLGNYLIHSVSKEAGINGKIQTPQIMTSPNAIDKWKTWTLD